MRRIFLIARREYLAYARTLGFWLSLLLVPVFMLAGAIVPSLIERATPQKTVALVDLTGRGLEAKLHAAFERAWVETQANALRSAALEAGFEIAGAVNAALAQGGLEAGLAAYRQAAPERAQDYAPPKRSVLPVEAPPALREATSTEALEVALKPFVTRGDTQPRLADGRALDAVALLVPAPGGGEPQIRLWTESVTDRTLESAVREAMRDVLRTERFAAAGLDQATVEQIGQVRPELNVFSPRAAGDGQVSIKDRLPGLVGFILGVLLWVATLSGASLLMNSIIEEKSNRVLEVLLASAAPREILTGKVLGVAALTFSVLLVWAALATLLLGGGMRLGFLPGFVAELAGVAGEPRLILLFALFMIGGYLMYAALFASIGAFCETAREAQTLLQPVIVLMVVPLFIMNFAIRTPDMPLVKLLSLVPPFAPFLMTARAPSNPPLWEVAVALAGMALFAAVAMWAAGRAFRIGALSGGSEGKAGWHGLKAAFRGRTV